MKKNYKVLFILCISLMLAFLFAGCTSKSGTVTKESGKLKVAATIYPVYEFVKQVGGDKVEVFMLVPPGAEPHDWEPTAKDLIKVKSAKVLIYQGGGLEPVEKLLAKDVLGDTVAVEAGKGLIHRPEEHAKEEQHEHGHEHADTHVWLDPQLAQQEVDTIAAALVAVDTANADYYKKNAAAYKQQLKELNEEYTKTLSAVSRKEIVTSHEAFGYLAKRYGLEQVGIMGLSPDAEPTPEKMAEVAKFCKEHQVKYIFFETLASPKLSQTLAKETGAGLLVLNPIENLTEEEVKQGKNYISLMKENLANLEKALK